MTVFRAEATMVSSLYTDFLLFQLTLTQSRSAVLIHHAGMVVPDSRDGCVDLAIGR